MNVGLQVVERLFGVDWTALVEEKATMRMTTRVVLEVGGYPGGPPSGPAAEALPSVEVRRVERPGVRV